MRHEFLHKIRTLTVALIVSGGLNITLIGVTAYWILKERPPTPYCELKPASQRDRQAPLALDASNSEAIRHLKRLSLPKLVNKLNDARLVENGYTERDLALGCMLSFHYFDFSRATTGLTPPKQKRDLAYFDEEGKPATIPVFPNLSDEHFATITRFYQTEQWPLTNEGLFTRLKIAKEEVDPSLAYAFFLTPEFLSLETLLQRSESSIEKKEILQVALDGNWKMLNEFSQRQRLSQDLSDAHRQKILIDYIDAGSKSAASLLLKTDPTFAAKKLDDTHVLQMLRLMTERSASAARFALAMLMSPRSDNVWQEAASRLYEYVGEPKPQQYHRNVVLARFVPLAVAPKDPIKEQKSIISQTTKIQEPKKILAPQQKKSPPKPKLIQRSYTVKEGDTLWKISRRFNVDVSALKKLNQLTDTPLKPGLILSIPSNN